MTTRKKRQTRKSAPAENGGDLEAIIRRRRESFTAQLGEHTAELARLREARPRLALAVEMGDAESKDLDALDNEMRSAMQAIENFQALIAGADERLAELAVEREREAVAEKNAQIDELCQKGHETAQAVEAGIDAAAAALHKLMKIGGEIHGLTRLEAGDYRHLAYGIERSRSLIARLLAARFGSYVQELGRFRTPDMKTGEIRCEFAVQYAGLEPLYRIPMVAEGEDAYEEPAPVDEPSERERLAVELSKQLQRHAEDTR